MNKYAETIKRAHDGEIGPDRMCKSWRQFLEGRHPELFETPFKEEDWVVYTLPDSWMEKHPTHVYRTDYVQEGYLYVKYDYWHKRGIANAKVSDFRQAKIEEIEDHLKQEAKARGYQYGIIVEALGNYGPKGELLQIPKDMDLGNYYQGLDSFQCGPEIYNKGTWAKIIGDATPLKEILAKCSNTALTSLINRL